MSQLEFDKLNLLKEKEDLKRLLETERQNIEIKEKENFEMYMEKSNLDDTVKKLKPQIE